MKKLFTLLLLVSSGAMAQSWAELGSGSNALNQYGNINAICTDSKGNVYAAGNFMNKQENAMVAKWDGTKWTELGADTHQELMQTGTVYAMTIDAYDNIYLGGSLRYGLGVDVIKWGGSQYEFVGNFKKIGTIKAICLDKKGNYYAAGQMGDSTVTYIYKNSSYTKLSNSFSDDIETLCCDTAGNIYAGGQSKFNGKYLIHKWDGTNWTEIGASKGLDAKGYIWRLVADKKGNLYATGAFVNADDEYYVAKYDGTSWSELGSGTHALHAKKQIWALTTDDNGNVYAAGEFQNAGGKAYVSRWNGTDWAGVGTTSINANSGIRALLVDGNDVYAGGYFTNSDNKTYVAKVTQKVGIKEGNTTALVTIYPNPATSTLTIQYPTTNQKEELLIYNMLGEVVYKETLLPHTHTQTHTLNLVGWVRGMYLVKMGGAVEKVLLE